MSINEKFRDLPVAMYSDEVCSSLAKHSRLILTAPPGAGKSTLLPLALLERFPDGRILMLEPRRMAAQHVAERMAAMLGQKVGETVGYRVRFDSRISDSTRIEVVTEGIMERMLIDDPTLDGVGMVIFDEFHERSLSSDLCMALTREIQNIIRPDMKILVMSATIDALTLSVALDAPVIDCPGRSFEVKVIYSDETITPKDCVDELTRLVWRVLKTHEGNVLVFLPGQAEILKCRERLAASVEGVEILTLYGMMAPEKQRETLHSSHSGLRCVILASPIAETSLTIEGISVVVDSGFYRRPAFDPSTGLTRLETTRISSDMANQRAGRAGRLGPGTCYRMWTKATALQMEDCRQPEIVSADLASMRLGLAAWGCTNVMSLPWVTPPSSGNLHRASKLLQLLGALNATGALTAKGRRIAKLPCHPRIASMLSEAEALQPLACDIAALLEERDPCVDETDADLSTRLDMLHRKRTGKLSGQWQRIDNIAAQYRRIIRSRHSVVTFDHEDIGAILLKAYPERLAMRDEKGRYRLNSANSREMTLHPDDNLLKYEFLVVASMGSRIFLAAPVSRQTVSEQGEWIDVATWNAKEGRAVVRRELRFGCLTLATRQMSENTQQLIIKAIVEAAFKEGMTMFDFNEAVENLQLRISTAAAWHPEMNFPDVSTERILGTAADWLPMYIGKASTVLELRKINLCDVINGMLSYDRQVALDEIAPAFIRLPSGRNARVAYRRGAELPVVSARIQDCFGLMHTPRIDGGRQPVLMELLSPGFKPVQLTTDIEGFWQSTYFEIRKELRRRYPKHKWPENPLEL